MRETKQIIIKGEKYNFEIEKAECDHEYDHYYIYGRDRKIKICYSHKRAEWYIVHGRMSHENLCEIVKVIR